MSRGERKAMITREHPDLKVMSRTFCKCHGLPVTLRGVIDT